ncbi:protein DEHYDRATION-INDUCED 19 homolog 5-like [Humulus lupulus]|uniref:protein DEHYDRATION-INDUCED 19 homolog 5-like n=1 Tax=Humulus lupulus TaxID=3486 RepID=UPI002B412D1D|nr:protein DEHYDRATION-INDUCED 19 homolog 5-like [Humulus lupulus]
MDVDFWASRVHSAKHFSAVHAARLHSDRSLALDATEEDEDVRPCFPCPFCYLDIEVTSLCIHLQEEHCFDLKNAVCPLCAANLGRDVIGHFVVQHASSLKHRRKPHKSGFWTGSTAMLGKELSKRGREDSYESAPDPLLSPFICSLSFSELKLTHQDECKSTDAPVTTDEKSTEPSYCEKDNEERRQRAAFVQQLIESTIFLDH